MDLNEFRDAGYLMEVNRVFFHPLGLALAVTFDKDTGKVTALEGILDSRDDPEGFIFDELDEHDCERSEAIEALRYSKIAARSAIGITMYGKRMMSVQQIPSKFPR